MNTSTLEKLLEEKREADAFRQLKVADHLVDFCSNDYLGLAQSYDLFEIINSKAERLKPPYNGATGSRLLSGSSLLAEETEHLLARIFHAPKTLLFNSGYTANLAVLSSVPQRGDTIIYDELAHASIKDGARLSLATRYSFKHNDLNDLESKIKRANGNIFIAVESIYSMDGDECPLEELTLLAEKYDATILLDEAHSTGSYGDNGSGLAIQKKLEKKIGVRIYTFGKAMGVHGACVAGDEALINYLINFARPFIYTTAMAPHSLIAIGCAFDYLKKNIGLQAMLQKKIKLFRSGFDKINLTSTPSNSSIQNIIIPGNTQVKEVAHFLQHHNFDCRPILSPTIKAGSERIRICLHAFNSEDEIQELLDSLENFES
ncbi:MAG: aminotransferase class I/II-fold pyridoxal phosphate-dependent enzyme [Bacteroidetes bacterium]|nr:aminotransferase class I/II-fold pyridoxal phosphate-dependent enzyme [Bacteroidota bacterium]